MTEITPVDRSEIETALSTANISAVFEILQRYPDLRHTDLPLIAKSALQAIAARPETIRQITLGFASLFPSIRRFCKKYFPKLGATAAIDLLYLLVESLDPLRPVTQDSEGLLGSCGGYASPLGQTIRSANLSLVVRRPEIEVYSEASRLAREVLELIPSALAATDFATFLLGFEYYYGLGIFYSTTPKDYQSPLGSHSQPLLQEVFYHLTNLCKEVLRSRATKGDARLYEAMQHWLRHETLLDQARWKDTPIAPVQTQFLALRHPEVSALNLHWVVADQLIDFPQEQRLSLYLGLKDSFACLDDRQVQIMTGTSLRYYRDRYPEEAAQADRSRPTPPSPIPPSPPVAGVTATTTKSSESFGVDQETALSSLFAIANTLQLYGVARDLFVDDLDWATQEDFPSPRADPDSQKAEQLVQEIRQFVNAQETRLSLGAIAQTPYREPLFNLLQQAAMTYLTDCRQTHHSEDSQEQQWKLAEQRYWGAARLMLAAVIFLPDPLFQQWLDLWRDRIAPLNPFSDFCFSSHDDLPQLISARFPEEAPFLLLDLQGEKAYPSSDDDWQLRLAQAYAQQTDRGSQTVRQSLARVCLKSNPHYRRNDWHPPYLWLISQAWEQQDTELLAIACDRCAVPMYWKGEKAYSPLVKNYRHQSGYAPRTNASSDGAIAVQEIGKLVCERHPEFLPGIVQHNLQLASDERAACTLLLIFAQVTPDLTPFQTCMAGVLELLEAPQAYAIVAGLEIFTLHPELATEHLPDVLLATDRALASASTGVAKQAVQCLGQLAIAHPTAREQALVNLENILYSESKSLLEETLKVWKKILPQVNGAFPEAAVPRLQELATADPKRYGKLVQPLLPGGI